MKEEAKVTRLIGPLREAIGDLVEGSEAAAFLQRLHLVILLRMGVPRARVANWFGVGDRTLQRWERTYRRLGISGLAAYARRGRPARLNDWKLARLRGDLQRRPTDFGYARPQWTGSLLRVHLAHVYNVSLGIRQCQRLLRDLRPTSVAAHGEAAIHAEDGSDRQGR